MDFRGQSEREIEYVRRSLALRYQGLAYDGMRKWVQFCTKPGGTAGFISCPSKLGREFFVFILSPMMYRKSEKRKEPENNEKQ